jgi:predicted phage-related endonuclease
VLIYGKGIKIYQITRIPNDTTPEWCESSVYIDDAECDALTKATADFWNLVEQGIPPIADGSKSTSQTLTAIYPESNGDTVSLFAYESDLKQYKHLASMEEDYKNMKDEVANRIKAFMGEAGKGESDSFKVSWTSSVRSTFDHKAFAQDNPGLDLSRYYKQTNTRTFKVTERK